MKQEIQFSLFRALTTSKPSGTVALAEVYRLITTDASLKESTEKATVILISHRTSTLMHADKILVLDDGECVGIGNHEQLINECDVYKEIYYCQFPDEKKA